MRISPRNPDDMNPKTVIVMDRATAEWMAGTFPGCTVAPLGGMGDMPVKGKPGRTREHDSDADRKRASRDQFRSELRMALDLVAGGDRAARHCSPAIAELRQQMSEFGHGRDQLSARWTAPISMRSVARSTPAIDSAEPLDFFPRDDIETFIDGLRWWHKFAYESKEANGLISPAIFDQSLSEDTQPWTGEHPRHLGHLAGQRRWRSLPRGVRSAVPSAPHGDLQQLSSKPEKPRWRVFIPTTVAMPIAAYRPSASRSCGR